MGLVPHCTGVFAGAADGSSAVHRVCMLFAAPAADAPGVGCAMTASSIQPC
jgi:hypothetical protein